MKRFCAPLVLSITILAIAPTPSSAAGGCRNGRPKSGLSGLATGLFDRVSRRVTGTGIVGDIIAEGRTFLSDTIACALTDAENKQALAAQQKALNSRKTGKGSRTEWTSADREGVTGGTEIVTRSRREGQECAVQRTFITDVNGEQKSVEREFCQGEDGKWGEA